MGKKPKRLPVLREDRTIEIPLTKGYVAIVDWEDVWAAGHLWTAVTTPTGHTYAMAGKRALHCEIMRHTPVKGFDVDHIDGDTLNNRRANLRVITHQANTHNRIFLNKNNKTGFPGIRFADRRWQAHLSQTYVGGSKVKSEAMRMRYEAELEKWGYQARRTDYMLELILQQESIERLGIQDLLDKV